MAHTKRDTPIEQPGVCYNSGLPRGSNSLSFSNIHIYTYVYTHTYLSWKKAGIPASLLGSCLQGYLLVFLPLKSMHSPTMEASPQIQGVVEAVLQGWITTQQAFAWGSSKPQNPQMWWNHMGCDVFWDSLSDAKGAPGLLLVGSLELNHFFRGRTPWLPAIRFLSLLAFSCLVVLGSLF